MKNGKGRLFGICGICIGVLLVTVILWTAKEAMAAEGYTPFDGEKTAWHGGFERYDFIMVDANGAITPMKAPEKETAGFGIDATLKDGKRRCVVIVPKKAAPRYP